MEEKVKKVFKSEEVEKVLVNVVRLFVDEPDKVVCSVHQSEHSVIFEITTSRGDYGKVVGKDGRMANALRTIVRAIAGNFDRRLILEFVYKEEGKSKK